MGLYFDGYSEALRKVDSMSEAECLEVLDALYGRENLRYGDGVDELRQEVRRQYAKEFRNDSDPGWETVDFFTNMPRNPWEDR